MKAIVVTDQAAGRGARPTNGCPRDTPSGPGGQADVGPDGRPAPARVLARTINGSETMPRSEARSEGRAGATGRGRRGHQGSRGPSRGNSSDARVGHLHALSRLAHRAL